MRSQLFIWNFYDFMYRAQVRQRTSINSTYLTIWEKGIGIL